jgi:hypothetical protein
MQGAPIPECLPSAGSNCQPVQAVILCDQHPEPPVGDGLCVSFLRVYFYNCDTGALMSFSDFDLDGNLYVVIGTVENCEDNGCIECIPDTFHQHREQIVGVGAWVRPVGASAVTVKCRAVGDVLNPPTITDASAVVTPLFVGDEETWESPDGTPFLSGFTVTANDPGDLITIIWLETI